jgi:CBS domain containing-hemolysin-like protein
VLVLANAWFVLGEFALISVDRGRVERLARGGDGRARSVLAAIRRLTLHLSGAQLGITLSSLLVGFVAEPALASLLREPLAGLPGLAGGLAVSASLALAFALATVVQMVVGEQVPKSVAIAHPLRSAMLVATPLRAFCWLGRPLIALLNGTANALVRRLGVEPREEMASAPSIEELELVIRTSAREGTLDRPTARLLGRAVRFRRKTVRDVLRPRVAVVGLSVAETAARLVQAAIESGYTRFPVYGRDLDDIVGTVDVKDGLRLPAGGRPLARIDALMRPPLVLPESLPLDQALARMRAGEQRMAVAIDEYGGTAGIVTMEDVLEEVAGEIEERPPVRPPGDGRSRVLPGGAQLDQVLDETGLELPSGEYATLAGFLLHRLGEFPRPGDVVEADGWTLRVLAMDGRRVAWVSVGRP